MKRVVTNRLGQLARTYWQPLVLIFLALLAFSQVVSWGVTAVELKKVDNLIERTQKTQAAPDAPNGEGSEPGKNEPGGAKPPSEQNQPPKPAKNIFKKEETNYAVTAIYLDQAVVNGQPLKVGQNIGKAKLKEIGMNHVVIEEENGQTKTINMFQGGGNGGPPPSSRPPNRASSRNGNGRRSTTSNRPPSAPQRLGSPSGPPAGFSFRGVNAEQFRSMSRDERRNFYNNLSPSEQAQLRQQAPRLRGGR
ncbi:MAG: hypothetical protein JXR73_10250 [Candidatus Omnitrophica bacterium]|nr:hypothetical protein [Candidatus Omnitrophota bacterium]